VSRVHVYKHTHTHTHTQMYLEIVCWSVCLLSAQGCKWAPDAGTTSGCLDWESHNTCFRLGPSTIWDDKIDVALLLQLSFYWKLPYLFVFLKRYMALCLAYCCFVLPPGPSHWGRLSEGGSFTTPHEQSLQGYLRCLIFTSCQLVSQFLPGG
jgi:hypothetical protein